MKKLITLAAVVLVAGCDPYNDEPSGTPKVMYAMDLAAGGIDEAGPDYAVDVDATAGNVFVVKANVLLDGASIEQTPQSCIPADGWLTVTSALTFEAAPLDPDVDPTPRPTTWYTCYNPTTASDAEPGGAVWIYPAATAATATANPPAPFGDDSGYLTTAGDFSFAGEVLTDGGDVLPIAATVSAGIVTLDPESPSNGAPSSIVNAGSAAIPVTATLDNRDDADTHWTVTATVRTIQATGATARIGAALALTADAGGTWTGGADGSLAGTYTPPTALNNGITSITVRITATNRAAHDFVVIRVIP